MFRWIPATVAADNDWRRFNFIRKETLRAKLQSVQKIAIKLLLKVVGMMCHYH